MQDQAHRFHCGPPVAVVEQANRHRAASAWQRSSPEVGLLSWFAELTARSAIRCTLMNRLDELRRRHAAAEEGGGAERRERQHTEGKLSDRKSTRLNSSHLGISYA